jgi:hypothetical protein
MDIGSVLGTPTHHINLVTTNTYLNAKVQVLRSLIEDLWESF